MRDTTRDLDERDDDRRTDAERRLEAIVALLRQDASTTALDGIGEHLEAIYARLPGAGSVSSGRVAARRLAERPVP